MPANPKYLTTSKRQRFAKISAGILGGYLVSTALHLVLVQWSADHEIVMITFEFSLFLLWILFLILPFLFKNGWKCWNIYLGIILVCVAAISLGKIYHPIN